MRQITVEDHLGRELVAASEQIVLCDAAGRALGFFSPLGRPTPVADLQLECPTPPEEIERRRRNPTGKPLSDILGRLRAS